MEGRIAWHTGFQELIQAEFLEYCDQLTFYFEYMLTKEPLRLDALVIRKPDGVVIDKHIGVIFRRANIIEYKSPEDYVSIGDYYKVVNGYAGIYAAYSDKSDEGRVDIWDTTVTFVQHDRPKKLVEHLQKARHCVVNERWPGIYVVEGEIMPVQIIASAHLSDDDSRWLKSYDKGLSAERLDGIFRAVVNEGISAKLARYIRVLMEANLSKMQEVEAMEKSIIDIVYEATGYMPEKVIKAENKARQEARQEAQQEAQQQVQQAQRQVQILMEQIRQMGGVPAVA
jgi:hypothetical protein